MDKKDEQSPSKKKVGYRQPAGPNLLLTQQQTLQLLRSVMQATPSAAGARHRVYALTPPRQYETHRDSVRHF